MRVYTVHLPPGHPSTGHGPDAVVIKEGFSWPAFFFTVLWAAWQRLWLVTAALLAAAVALDLVVEWTGADATLGAILGLGCAGFAGAFANDWRRAALVRGGWRFAGVVAAPDRDAGLRRYFDLHPPPAGRAPWAQ